MNSGTEYAAALMGIICAEEQVKGELLQQLRAPQAEWRWSMPPLPPRPGRSAAVQEGRPPRRRRGIGNPLARAQFLHAIWHIEVSAIDLAVVCSLAGSGMPVEFHAEQLRVAREEAEHSQLVAELLMAMGRPPGHDPVHHRLWDSALLCASLGEHLVVIPRFLEARGLDVNADILPRFAAVDSAAHGVLERIYQDEIGHVATGTHWHQQWCVQQGCDPAQHFSEVLYKHGLLRFPNPAPLDYQGRLAAGFSEAELTLLDSWRVDA